MLNPINHPFAGLPLWERFVILTAHETANKKMVDDHITYALPLLDHFIVAFPKYTLHNRQHQYNIIKLMGELLQEKLEKLSGLEAAILILSALYHDIGMIYSPKEIATIIQEPEFEDFFKNNTSARLQYEENKRVATSGLVEWYCRWMHAKRVWVFLNKADQQIPFLWSDVPIKVELGNVCESHNESIDYIKRHEELFATGFLGQCDLTFCALLLRLADIMDFDNSRSPQSVYEYLELDKAKKGSDAVSDEEWQKHLSSKGFIFQRENARSKLLFIAVPEQPKVEISIRSFIKVIDAELNACARLLKFCSSKWQGLELPGEINLDGIKSKNYRSGNYRFSLSESNVMTLLSGEGIYNDNYIFLRELLQNALDTSRHREFREQVNNRAFKAQPIVVSYFTDVDGYQWIRIDDYGMGMNEEIIEKHLLKKGESYYNSDNFKLEKLMIQEKAHTDFVPISRFGIGLLSCFITGDRIEISTLHNDEPGNPFRLSVEGRNGFFMMQAKKDHHTPAPMPAEYKPEDGYRTVPGTSIAVRITTNKEYEGFDIKQQLERYLMAPPVAVVYNGNPVGGDFEALLTEPWAKDTTFDVTDTFVTKAAGLTGLQFSKGLQVKILSVSLTEKALTPKIKGQLVIVYVQAHPDQPPINPGEVTFRLELQDEKLQIHCIRERVVDGKKSEERVSEDISTYMSAIKAPDTITRSPYYPFERYYFGGIKLSHNGIRVLEDQKLFELNGNHINNNDPFSMSYHNNWSFFSTGVVYLQDELLPDLTISRNEIKGISFPIIANVLAATRELQTLITRHPEQKKFDFFKELDREIDYSTYVIAKSLFYEDHQEYWDKEIMVPTSDGPLTIQEIKTKGAAKINYNQMSYTSLFYSHFVDYVLQVNFDVSVDFTTYAAHVQSNYYLSPRSLTLPTAFEGFAPLTFVAYENSPALMISRNINLKHPYVIWYMRAYLTLNNYYYYYSRQLIYALSGSMKSLRPEIEKINNILERLRELLPEELRPPKEINLSLKDFEFKV
jgi:hypothetical protein